MENECTKNVTFFRFEGLRVYDKALEYVDWAYNTTMMIPDNHSKELISRFNSSAQDIAFNIAEGSARSKSQFVHYLKLAKTSIRECVVLTTIAEKQAFITESIVEESRCQLMEMTKMIGALIGSLQRQKPRNNYNKNRDVMEDEAMPVDEIDINKY